MQQLDLWSLQKFKKPIFNGRDEIWENGLNVLFNNLLFGRGNLEGNWHNCIITVLTAYGIIGSTLWVMAFQKNSFKRKIVVEGFDCCWMHNYIPYDVYSTICRIRIDL